MVVTGDITQIDLPTHQESGLSIVRDILEGIDDISFMDLTSEDVVTLNGDIVNSSFGSVRLNPGVNKIVIEVNSF